MGFLLSEIYIMAQRLQFTNDMARWLCNFSDDDIGKIFRSITSFIYEGIEIKLPEKLQWVYFILKPYIDDDIERHTKYIKWKKNWWVASWITRASTIKKKHKRSKWTEWTEWTEWTTDNDNDIYTSNIEIVSNIKEKDLEKLKKEFPEKNIEVEIKKMCNNRAGKWKQIKKPIQALRNWLLPKEWQNGYVIGIENKTDDQWVTEFLSGKNAFNDKYWWDKYQEVKDLWIKKCLAQPLSL